MEERRRSKRTEMSSTLMVKRQMKRDSYMYGAVFIGMPESDAARIRVYQTVNDEK